ncbi:hypothetical protein BD779DRAFT_911163 [Infundibulicybe gibba]|nr:hypothetical protein BD779DRAFT_911163 [Infundibulicybe gibba]
MHPILSRRLIIQSSRYCIDLLYPALSSSIIHSHEALESFHRTLSFSRSSDINVPLASLICQRKYPPTFSLDAEEMNILRRWSVSLGTGTGISVGVLCYRTKNSTPVKACCFLRKYANAGSPSPYPHLRFERYYRVLVSIMSGLRAEWTSSFACSSSAQVTLHSLFASCVAVIRGTNTWPPYYPPPSSRRKVTNHICQAFWPVAH